MIWAFAFAVAAAGAAGVYLATSRDVLRCAIGLSFVSGAVTLLVLAAGRVGSPLPPVIPPGGDRLVDAAAPLPQALVLTAVVIGFALVCFALVLVLAVIRLRGSDDALALRDVEPLASDPREPPVESVRAEETA